MSQYLQQSAEEENTLRAENIKILHRLQSLLTNANLSSLKLSEPSLSSLHQVLVCRTYVSPQLYQFWNSPQSDIAQDIPYITNIKDIKLQLSELQENGKEAKLLKSSAGLPEDWKDVERVLQYQELSYVPEIICSKVISRYHDDLLAEHFGIDKTRELVSRKYYWPSLKRDVKTYVRECDIFLASKPVRHKPHRDLQSLFVSTHWWKDLSMDFVTSLPLFAD